MLLYVVGRLGAESFDGTQPPDVGIAGGGSMLGGAVLGIHMHRVHRHRTSDSWLRACFGARSTVCVTDVNVNVNNLLAIWG